MCYKKDKRKKDKKGRCFQYQPLRVVARLRGRSWRRQTSKENYCCLGPSPLVRQIMTKKLNQPTILYLVIGCLYPVHHISWSRQDESHTHTHTHTLHTHTHYTHHTHIHTTHAHTHTHAMRARAHTHTHTHARTHTHILSIAPRESERVLGF